MQIRSEHVTGLIVGLGAAAAGFYYYKKNQPQVDAFLRKHGIDLPAGGGIDPAAMTIEQLIAEKETLEDLIAEREYAASQTPETPAPAAGEKAPEAPGRKKTTPRTAAKR